VRGVSAPHSPFTLAVLDVFHAADAPALGLETLHAVPSEDWPALKLRTHPAVEIVHSEWRIADLLHTVEQGREWTDPEHEEASVLLTLYNIDTYDSLPLWVMQRVCGGTLRDWNGGGWQPRSCSSRA
jgi:hypothetical protein